MAEPIFADKAPQYQLPMLALGWNGRGQKKGLSSEGEPYGRK
jgi:hypothetical protein